MNNLLRRAVLIVISATLWAQAPPPVPAAGAANSQTPNQPAAKAGTKSSARKKAVPAATAEAVKQQAAMEAELQRLRDQLQQRDTALQVLQQRVGALETVANQAQATAQATAQSLATTKQEEAARIDEVQSKTADLKVAQGNTLALVEKSDKRVSDLEQPTQIHFRGVTLTPAGYGQASTVFRLHNQNLDTNDSFGSIPFNDSVNGQLSEFRFSGRASRFSLRGDATVAGAKVMGYAEMDFLGAAPTANENQTNSFQPRLRLAFAEVELPAGLSVAAGQNWSLLQTTRQGITPLTEFSPAVVSNSYIVGFSYARQASVRVVKSLGTKTWIGFALENPETTLNAQCLANGKACPSAIATLSSGGVASATTDIAVLNPATSGALAGIQVNPNNSAFAAPVSVDRAPDVVAKVAFEPGWGHYELKAVGRFYRDRVYPNFNISALNAAKTSATLNLTGASNTTTESGGVGFGMILPVLPKKVDIVAQALGGRGIGRYGAGGPDVTLRPDGTLIPVKALQTTFGVETHPHPKFDFDLYGGYEYYQRTTYTVPTGTKFFGATTTAPVIIGYGSPAFVDTSCTSESPSSSSCMSSSQNRNLWTVAPSVWYRIFKSKQGMLQYGMTYTFVNRATWAGTGGSPEAAEHIFMTSFRYYLP